MWVNYLSSKFPSVSIIKKKKKTVGGAFHQTSNVCNEQLSISIYKSSVSLHLRKGRPSLLMLGIVPVLHLSLLISFGNTERGVDGGKKKNFNFLFFFYILHFYFFFFK
jgi:hypothetical protein